MNMVSSCKKMFKIQLISAFLFATFLSGETFSPDFLRKMADINKLSEEQLNAYLPYIYPREKHPVTGALLGSDEAFLFEVPSILKNQNLAALGLVDVTSDPFAADPTGERDSTIPIQRAVDFARDNQMACFFPQGEYRVSNTIECLQKLTVRPNGKLMSCEAYPVILIGAAGPKRPQIFLAPNSPGFLDPSSRKILIHFYSCNTASEIKPEQGPLFPQANIGYNNMFRGIDLKIGKGNTGAVGIRMQAAEGSSIQDTTIDVEFGDTGMQGAAGSGGAHHNIKIIGGRVGIDTRGWAPQFSEEGPGTQPGPMMSHVTLIGQSETAAVIYSSGPFTAVGWQIETSASGTAIRAVNTSGQYYLSQFNLIDSVVIFQKKSHLNSVIEGSQGVFFRNVYTSNASSIHKDTKAFEVWTQVKEYASPGAPTQYKGKNGSYSITQPLFLNGVKTGLVCGLSSNRPPPDLCDRHIWQDPFPSWEQGANVKLLYGAKGDGRTDDTKAIQKAVDENEIVFLPKGFYRVTDTIRLKSKTKLIGVHFTMSVITAHDPFGALSGDTPKPILDTPDDADAVTTLAFVGISLMKWSAPSRAQSYDFKVPCYAIRWRAGEKSIVRSPWVRRVFSGVSLAESDDTKWLTNLSWEYPLVRIEENGGGKWFNFFSHGSFTDRDSFRHIVVSNTHNSLAFYHLHAQHAEGDFQCEIIGSSNIDIYGIKTECETSFLRVKNSGQFRIFGHSGWGSALSGEGLYVFENCSNFLFSCFGGMIKDVAWPKKPWKKYQDTVFMEWYPIVETIGEMKSVIGPNERPMLYERGKP